MVREWPEAGAGQEMGIWLAGLFQVQKSSKIITFLTPHIDILK